MHLVEVIALALEARSSLPQKVPERRYLEPAAAPSRSVSVAATGLAIGIVAVLSALAARRVWSAADR